MVTRAAFDNQCLGSESPEQKCSGASLNLICFLRVYDLFPNLKGMTLVNIFAVGKAGFFVGTLETATATLGQR